MERFGLTMYFRNRWRVDFQRQPNASYGATALTTQNNIEEKLIITKWNQNQFLKTVLLQRLCIEYYMFVHIHSVPFFIFIPLVLSSNRAEDVVAVGRESKRQSEQQKKAQGAMATIEKISSASWRYLSTCIIVSCHPTQEQSQCISAAFAMQYLVQMGKHWYLLYSMKSQIIAHNDCQTKARRSVIFCSWAKLHLSAAWYTRARARDRTSI